MSGVSLTCFRCFLPANTTNEKSLNHGNITIPFFAILKPSRPETFETETRRNGSRDESHRDRDQVSRLHHCLMSILAYNNAVVGLREFVRFNILKPINLSACETSVASGVRRKFPRVGQSFVTIVWRHKSTLGEVPKARPF